MNTFSSSPIGTMALNAALPAAKKEVRLMRHSDGPSFDAAKVNGVGLSFCMTLTVARLPWTSMMPGERVEARAESIQSILTPWAKNWARFIFCSSASGT